MMSPTRAIALLALAAAQASASAPLAPRASHWARRRDTQLAPGEGPPKPPELARGVRRAVLRIGRSMGMSISAVRATRKAWSQSGREPFKFKVMQFNMLADGLAFDGFLAPRQDDKEFGQRVADTFKFIKDAKAKSREKEGTKFDAKFVKQFAKAYAERKTNFTLMGDAEKQKESENEERLVKWPERIGKILGIILDQGPDIIVLQELDHYADLAAALSKEEYGYTSVMGTDPEEYTTSGMQDARLSAISKLNKDEPNKDNQHYRKQMERFIPLQSEAYATELQKLAGKGVAFAPNVNSNARKFALKDDWGGKEFKENPEKDPDDQGVAIFWKKSNFDAKSVEMSLIGKSSKADAAALMVELQPKPATGTAGPVRVITTHLSSGPEKELRRHHELEDVRKAFIQGHKPAPTIFATDMNSDIWFDTTKDKHPEELKTNCFELVTGDAEKHVKENEQDWDTKMPIKDCFWGLFSQKTLKRWGMKSIWSEYMKAGEGVPASVLKMRGPATAQPHKMGELAFETIDHVFYSGKGLEMVTDTADVVGQMKGRRMTKKTRQGYISAITGAKKGEGAPSDEDVSRVVNMMLPSKDTPSDHFPVVAEFTLS
mmetsp:Transcript_111010/g.314164  ORF Transcript_111010/g.314164 Transcript_111010/m.314164 type:complete len:603 (-) Transcript_111010:2-1810(-)